MTQSPFDLLLHPVRMRIIQALVGGKRMTVQELGERLATVPMATLYRHLNALADGSVLVVVEERRVRGTVERVYALQEERISVPPEAMARVSPADHMRYFTTFVAGLLGSFSRYLRRSNLDFERDGVGYRQVTLQLSDQELRALLDDLNERMARDLANEPAPERRPRVLTRIVMPEEPIDDDG